MTDRTTFRKNLIERIDASGMTLTELSRRSGVSRDQISKLYHKRVEVTNSHDAMRLAQVFGSTVEEMSGAQADNDLAAAMARLAALPPDVRRIVVLQLEALAKLPGESSR